MTLNQALSPLLHAYVAWLAPLPDAGPWQFRFWRGHFLCLSKASGLYALKDGALEKVRP